MQHKQRKFISFIQRVLLNKYAFVLVLFFVYLVFFDDHNLIKRYTTRQEIKQLEFEYQYYLQEIEENKAKINQLNNDSVYLEKFAREKYFMKKDNEDVFILK